MPMRETKTMIGLTKCTLFLYIVATCLPTLAKAGRTCLGCKGAVAPVDCDTITRCADTDKCFIDMYVTTIGTIRYDLGCRDSMQCPRVTSQGRRYSSSDSLLSTTCCTGDLCNVANEHIKGYNKTMGPVCFNCPSQAHYTDCNKIRVCGHNEQCAIRSREGFVGHFETGCERAEVCQAYIAVGKKRTTKLSKRESTCKGCCNSNLCNTHCNTPSVNVSPCDVRPCKFGTCRAVGTSYVCDCHTGYTGTTCDTTIPVAHCVPNPCHHGTCKSHATGFLCTCHNGFTGSTCATIDHCASSPCIHGSCRSTSSGFSCTCHAHYSGTKCELLSVHAPCSPDPCVHGTCVKTGTATSDYLCDCLGKHLYHGTNCELRCPSIPDRCGGALCMQLDKNDCKMCKPRCVV